MIQFVEHKNINRKKWDNCINKSSNECIFVYSWYLDIACENHWCALVLNDYEAVFPLAEKSKLNIYYLYQPFFTRYFGVFNEGKITSPLLKEFFQAIPEKYKYIEFCLHHSIDFNVSDFESISKVFQSLDLNKDYLSIQNSYSENAKRSIKKATNAKLEIRNNISPEKIISLFRTSKGKDVKEFKEKDYATLLKLMNKCLQNKSGISLGIFNDNALCAAAFFIKSNNRYVFLKSGMNEVGKTYGAMHLLFNHFIKEHSASNVELDFGGSNIESIARFFKNFGAKDCVYLQVKKNNLSPFLKWIKSKK